MLKEPKSMDECSFFTRRILDDDGTRLVAWVPKGTNVVNVIYICGKCGKKGEVTQEYKKPITFVCEHCGHKIVVEPIKKFRGRRKKSS
ncbi:MAG: hypothetical protein J7K22_02270 [Nanoarchaeota archaeon]|nr:hypothetical protein [Nanoarchaeota archaeon]